MDVSGETFWGQVWLCSCFGLVQKYFGSCLTCMATQLEDLAVERRWWWAQWAQWTQWTQWTQFRARGGRKLLQVWWHTPSRTHKLKKTQCTETKNQLEIFLVKGGVSSVQREGDRERGSIRGVVLVAPSFVRTLPILPGTLTAMLYQTAPAWVGRRKTGRWAQHSCPQLTSELPIHISTALDHMKAILWKLFWLGTNGRPSLFKGTHTKRNSFFRTKS